MSSSKAGLATKLSSKNGGSGLGQLMKAKVIYSFAADGGGAPGLITPKKNVFLPKNAVLVGATINSTTAGAGATATISVGTSAGSSAASILAATAVASFSTNALLNGVPTFAAPVKLSAAGYVTLTTATAALTAGVFEVVLYFYTANA